MSDETPWGVWDVGHYDATATPSNRRSSRAWEGAETNRLNEAHWADASVDTLASLRTDLPELYRRVRHESINNPVIDGAIETQCTNHIGATGPALQILTIDPTWNETAEAIFAAWAGQCEHQERMSLVDLLEGWIAQYEIYGAIFAQERIGRRLRDYTILDLGPEAIETEKAGKNIHSGVETDEDGRVVAIHCWEPTNPSGKRWSIPAEFALHCFRRRFAMQRRGFARLASTLDPAANIRDYDEQVTDAARAQADSAVYLVAKESPAEFTNPTSNTLPIQRRTLRYIRPGWEPKFAPSTQPGAQYPQFRKERHTDIANAMEMPWMVFRKDASSHNMSAARFDAARYHEGVKRTQARLARRILNLIVRRVIRIAQLQGLLGPTPVPPNLELLRFEFPGALIPIAWTWPKPPAVDPAKEAMAERVQLENGTLAWSEAVAANGRRPEETLRLRSRDNAALRAAGLLPIMGAIPSQLPGEVLAAMLSPDPAEDTPANSAAGDAAPFVTPPIDPNADIES